MWLCRSLNMTVAFGFGCWRRRHVGCVGVGSGCVGYPVMISSALHHSAINTTEGNCIPASAHDHLTQEPLLAESPPLLPRHMPTPPPQNVISALPFLNVMVPIAENFGGPVNMCVSPSVDPSGADLPINGKSLCLT